MGRRLVFVRAMLAFESLAAERGYDAVADTLADFYLASLIAR